MKTQDASATRGIPASLRRTASFGVMFSYTCGILAFIQCNTIVFLGVTSQESVLENPGDGL